MQTIALSLLIAVQTLLLQADKTPDLKPELRAQINQVAQVALSVAQQALNTPVLSTPEVNTPKATTTTNTWVCTYDNNGKELACGG